MGVKVGDWAFELSLLASWVFLFASGLKNICSVVIVPTLSYGVQTGVEWEARKRKRNGSIGVLTADIIKTNLNSRNLKQAAMYTYQMR
jgi:hypothetical protein